MVNSLTPKRDSHPISLDNITMNPHITVTRTKEMISD